MPDSNRTSMYIHLVDINPEFLHTVYSLTGKRLIDLPKVHVSQGDPGFLEDARDSVRRADAHDTGRDTDGDGGDEFTDDGEVETSGHRAAGEEDSSSTIGYLGGVP